ncbi:MAG: nitroreductase [Gammaproteobacteria bacterium]|nr:MAG: nitroreductase [Gammaproteobacteria bacterium]
MKFARELIHLASRAPSGHNSQPWKFRIRDNTIEIHPDFDCALPVVDPDNRELYISLGCAAGNIGVAASRFRYRHHLSIEQDPGGTHYLAIELMESDSIDADPLFHWIEKRQTNRTVYNGTSMDDETLKQLESITRESGTSVHFLRNGEPDFMTVRELILEGNERQMNDPAFKNELLSWIRFNRRETARLRNGLTYETMGSPPTPRFIGKAIVGQFLKPARQNASDIRKIDSSSHLVLLTTAPNDIPQWILTGMTLQKLLLKLTECGLACAWLNPPCELESLSAELRSRLPAVDDEYPMIILRIGYADSVPFSPRKDIDDIME